MALMTKLVSKMLDLPPAETSKLEYQIDLKIPMSDGVVLFANRVAPVGGESLPIILIRDPYTFRGKKPDIISRLIAERGYQVIVQNCRGRWGSEGEFQPFQNEREDGLATLDWIADQPWFSGSVGMFGLSYWGYAQLALGSGAPAFLKALAPQMSASRVYGVFRAQGSISFFCLLTWLYQTYVINALNSPKAVKRARKQQKSALQRGFSHLPIGEADKAALNLTIPFYQEAICNDQPTDAFWAGMDHSKQVKDIVAPVHFIEGWYDFFLADQLADYESLRNAGKEPYMTIGPWTHAAAPGFKAGLKESLRWYDVHLRGNRTALRSLPIRIYVMGINKWVDFPFWPPPSTETPWYLEASGELTQEPPEIETEPSQYRYDPADPTPSVGGAMIFGGGPKNNRKLEQRNDVRTFTSQPMQEPLTIIGTVSVTLYVRSTNQYTDFFARLCDVSSNGRKSTNICDGIVRLTPDTKQADNDGIQQVTINLLATAHCFKNGHRIRLQVSSGAHPMFMRNLGTEEPITTGTRIQAADQEVFHDQMHCSMIMLPVAPTPK